MSAPAFLAARSQLRAVFWGEKESDRRRDQGRREAAGQGQRGEVGSWGTGKLGELGNGGTAHFA